MSARINVKVNRQAPRDFGPMVRLVPGDVGRDDADDDDDDSGELLALSDTDAKLRALRESSGGDDTLRVRVWRRQRDGEPHDGMVHGFLYEGCVSDELAQMGFEQWCSARFGGGRYEGTVTRLNAKNRRVIAHTVGCSVPGAVRPVETSKGEANDAGAASASAPTDPFMLRYFETLERRAEEADKRHHELQLRLMDQKTDGGMAAAIATIVSVFDLRDKIAPDPQLTPELVGMQALGDIASTVKSAAETGQLKSLFTGAGVQQPGQPALPNNGNGAAQSATDTGLPPTLHLELIGMGARGAGGMGPERAASLALDALQGVAGIDEHLAAMVADSSDAAYGRLAQYATALGLPGVEGMREWWLKAFDAIRFELSRRAPVGETAASRLPTAAAETAP